MLVFLNVCKILHTELVRSPCIHLLCPHRVLQALFQWFISFHHHIRWCACDRAWRSVKCTRQLHNQHLVRDASVAANVTTLLPKYWHHKTYEIW